MNYNEWITEQGSRIAREVWHREHQGRVNDLAVYVMPADGDKWGSLELAYSMPAGAIDVVQFPGVGERVLALPSLNIPNLLYHACQHMPLCGA